METKFITKLLGVRIDDTLIQGILIKYPTS